MLKLREGYEPLGLPGLGGFLFSPRSTPALDAADIANEALLDAIRALTFTIEKGVRRPVDYKNLGAEELGSVYESLLELHPELNVPAATFPLGAVRGLRLPAPCQALPPPAGHLRERAFAGRPLRPT
jgi:hypothetical protein